jgi:hypothetical protein
MNDRMARPARRIGNVPSEATTLIGRRHELTELRAKFATARVVSLVGPGGVGKTRLAIRAATDLARSFRDGAWFVDLAEVRDPALVSTAVATGLDLRAQAATEPLALLRSYLRDRQLLLVVDNCEHLLGTAAQLIDDVVRSAPGVRVLATSREPLSLPGEYVIPVPPLDLPSAHADEPASQLQRSESVMLFAERAAAASGRFEVTIENQAAVADLCRRLDGLPLAIELAAVRTRVPDRRADPGATVRPFCAPHRRRPGGAAAASHAAHHPRLEPRATRARGPGAAEAAVHLRGSVHARGRRRRLLIR